MMNTNPNLKSTSLLDRQTKYSMTSIPPLLASPILSYFCPEHIPPMDLITFAYRLTAEEALQWVPTTMLSLRPSTGLDLPVDGKQYEKF